MRVGDVTETDSDTAPPRSSSEGATDSSGDGGRSILVTLFAVYCLGLGLFRLPELTSALWIFELPAEAFAGIKYPSWWFWFLWAMVVGIIVVGLVATVGSVLRFLESPHAPRLLSGAAVMLAVWAVGQTVVRVVFDPDVAQGGLFWGTFHNLTLTRIENYGATPAGAAGYSAGLVVGGVVWLGGAVLLLRSALDARADQAEAREQTD